jgi:hypothetical protein
MKFSWKTVLLNGSAMIAVLMAVSWFSLRMISLSNEENFTPRIINSIRIEPANLRAGSSFMVFTNVTLNRLCPFQVKWSLVRKVDGVEVVKIVEPVQSTITQSGTQDLPPTKRLIPTTVAPGEYRYVSEETDLCPGAGGLSVTAARHNINITVR